MSSRFASASVRSALAVHASLSATSVLSSTFGERDEGTIPMVASGLAAGGRECRNNRPRGDLPNSRRHRRWSYYESNRRWVIDDETTTIDIRAALPWLDRLHAVVVELYAGGGGGGEDDDEEEPVHDHVREHHDVSSTVVRLGRDVSFEDPIVRHSGAMEIERAFRGGVIAIDRRRRPWWGKKGDDEVVETVLECLGVEASDDGICGGGEGGRRHPLVGMISLTPPRVVVTYRLSRRCGHDASFPRSSVDSLLIVTVQVRSRGCSEQVHRISRTGEEEAVVPMATSVIAPRAATALAASAATHSGVETLARLIKAANRMVDAATHASMMARGGGGGPHHHVDKIGRLPRCHESSPLVAEVVGMEERWNGVRLIEHAPFRWSRRLNGLLIAFACYFSCDSRGWN